MKALCVITSSAIGPQYFREMRDAATGGPRGRAVYRRIREILGDIEGEWSAELGAEP